METDRLPDQEVLSLPEAVRQAYRLLGAGALDDARTICGKVLEADPGNTNALYILGAVEYGLANYAQAENFLGRAREINPEWAAPHALCGTVCLRQEKYDGAVRAFREALRLVPGNAGFRLRLAESLAAWNDHDAAAELFRQVIAGDPASVEAWRGLAIALCGLERYDEAAAACREAMERSPADARAHLNLGLICWKAGELEQSERNYRRALELQPDLGAARHALAGVLREQGETASALRELEILAATIPDYPDVVRQMIGTRTLQAVEARAEKDDDGTVAPVFIVAPVGRCGSTLLQRLLNSSSELLVYGENLDVSKRLPECVDFAVWKAHLDNTDIAQNELARQSRTWSAGLFAGSGADYLELALNNFYGVIRHYQRAADVLGKRWGIKDPHAGQVGMLRRLLPRARFVFIYRDLPDVARSYKGRGWLGSEYDLVKLAHDWQEGIRTARLSGSSRILMVRYEDLVRARREEVGRIGEFLGIGDIDASVLDVRLNSPDEPYRQPQELTQRETDLLDRHAGGMRRWLGYACPSGQVQE